MYDSLKHSLTATTHQAQRRLATLRQVKDLLTLCEARGLPAPTRVHTGSVPTEMQVDWYQPDDSNVEVTVTDFDYSFATRLRHTQFGARMSVVADDVATAVQFMLDSSVS